MTPYTTRTGVQIGLLYKSNLPPHHDRDAELLQNALLEDRRRPMDIEERIVLWACTVAAASLTAMGLAGWL